jgi:CheY-like chemotaxis protein
MAKILIVDDDRDLAESQKVILEANGYTVEAAFSMQEGLERAAAFVPDLVIADLMMEHYDSGFVFGKKFRELRGCEKTPILMQTGASKEIGFTFDISKPGAKEWLKVDEIIDKPVTPEYLVGKVRQYLSK